MSFDEENECDDGSLCRRYIVCGLLIRINIYNMNSVKSQYIRDLNNRKSSFPAPEEARDKAKACDLLSRDIYNDSTRFVYELLQNADDASGKDGVLYFQIDFCGEYLVVSHKGKPFSEDDIESICSIGDGMKSTDENQTGFKGIGFKSVFAHSDFVIVRSGGFCFKFDKNACNVWYPEWGDQQEWEQKRKNKGKSVDFCMPWQVIPIETDLPDSIEKLPVFSDKEITVSTILRCKRIDSLKKAVEELFLESQIILFLRSKKVMIRINGDQCVCIEKLHRGEKTTLYRDKKVISEWLIKETESISIPSKIRESIDDDKEHYPEKLREASKTVLQFAVRIADGKLKPIPIDCNNIYAFLPTSVKAYAFPFIVNANFITDAGRQNLHQDYIWNQWLFELIPVYFLQWMSEMAKSEKYGLEFLDLIVPDIREDDELSRAYHEGMKSALEEIPLLKSSKGDLICVKEAVLDLTEVSSCISKKAFVEYLERYGKFREKDILSKKYSPFGAHLKDLGVFVFGMADLENFIKSDFFVKNHKISENAGFIDFLCNKYPIEENGSSGGFWLQNLPFVYDSNSKLLAPCNLCFPTNHFDSEYADNLDYINESVHSCLSDADCDWLKKLGVSEPNDTSLIDTRKLFEFGFITKENAVDILYYVFSLHQAGKLGYRHYEALHEVLLLTKSESLLRADNTYMSDIYKPDFPVEAVVDVDFYVSDLYLKKGGTANEWNEFLGKIAVCQDLTMRHLVVSVRNEVAIETNSVYCEYVNVAVNIAKQYSWVTPRWSKSSDGYFFSIERVWIWGIPYLPYANQYDFSKTLWNHIVRNIEIKEIFTRNVSVSGYTGLIFRSFSAFDLEGNGFETTYMKWVLQNKPIIPCTDRKCHLARDVYANTIVNAAEIAGEYLPVLDLDELLEKEWVEQLGLKTSFSLKDYLFILSSISQERQEEKFKQNKERVVRIYEALSEMLPSMTLSERKDLEKWAIDNKILAKDGGFYFPRELSIVLVDGFNGNLFAYYGHGDLPEKMIELMRCFGVSIIDRVSLKTRGNLVPIASLHDKFYQIVPLIALLRGGECSLSFRNVDDTLDSLQFISVNDIELSYGETCTINKKSYFDSASKKFYIVGDWSSIRILDGIESQLGKLFHLKNNTHMLKVLLMLDIDGVVEYLAEHGITIPEEVEKELLKRQKEFSGVIEVKKGHGYGDTVEISLSDTPYAGLSKQGMAEALVEAKKAVKKILEDQGFSFANATGLDSTTYGNIDGVKDPENRDCPLVVHSYKNQSRDFELTAFDWMQLAQPNSMLYVCTSEGPVCVPFYKLMENRGTINISFSTKNVECKDRMIVLASILSKFKGLHFDFGSLLPACTSVAERFNQPEKEMFETLSSDDALQLL